MMMQPRAHLRTMSEGELIACLAIRAPSNTGETVADDKTSPGALQTLALWARRYVERRRLARELPTFSDEVLEDFGLSREEAWSIARTPFGRD